MKAFRPLVLRSAGIIFPLLLLLTFRPALAQTEFNIQVERNSDTQDGLVVYTARKILTMERANPEATSVAVRGKRIVAVGSLAEVKSALGDAS